MTGRVTQGVEVSHKRLMKPVADLTANSLLLFSNDRGERFVEKSGLTNRSSPFEAFSHSLDYARDSGFQRASCWPGR